LAKAVDVPEMSPRAVMRSMRPEVVKVLWAMLSSALTAIGMDLM